MTHPVRGADEARDHVKPQGLGGWLLLLWIWLLMWQPLDLAMVAAGALEALRLRGWTVAFVLVVRLLVAAFGVAAAMALLRRHAAALWLCRIALISAAGADLLTYTTSWFPSNRPPGDTAPLVIGSLLFYAAWLIYLGRSKRVVNTYGATT
jgi:hypothetical protein